VDYLELAAVKWICLLVVGSLLYNKILRPFFLHCHRSNQFGLDENSLMSNSRFIEDEVKF
jgi:hypothetical protein